MASLVARRRTAVGEHNAVMRARDRSDILRVNKDIDHTMSGRVLFGKLPDRFVGVSYLTL